MSGAVELEAELKPCPFCGCAVELSENERDDNDRAPRPHRVYSIQCGCCETFIERVSLDWWSGSKPPPETDCDRDAKAEVIAAWNRRAAEAELATLRADNERLGRERDEAVESVNNLIGELNASGNKLVDENNRRMNSEAERDTLLAQVEGMRKALGACRPILQALIDTENNVDTWGINQRLAAVDAALTKEPS